ncbi:Glycoprotein-N-acetylgalactosamine 3-beta-galactosyltransferase 1 [Sarcoptes scabiei]|nr:Glycoprotein-N-acetylgalactosamine 3-beta-galactosyltransferase 1 [Sarcoptes scabiei]
MSWHNYSYKPLNNHCSSIDKSNCCCDLEHSSKSICDSNLCSDSDQHHHQQNVHLFHSNHQQPATSPSFSSSSSITSLSNNRISKSFMLALLIGMTFGFSFSYLLISVINWDLIYFKSIKLFQLNHPQSFNHFDEDLDAHSHEQLDSITGPNIPITFHGSEEEFHKVANHLSENIRVLCWVMTNPKNHQTKAKHVRATWGKRCNELIFISSQEDPSLPAINVEVPEGRDHLWAKTIRGFNYSYHHFLDKADWFLKADDDTFVIVENLRYFLSSQNSNDPIYFGCKFKPFVDQGYMSGGAGYVLSKEALKRFVEKGLEQNRPERCYTEDNTGAEDVDMGFCMEALNVTAGDSRDSLGRGRFFPFVPEHHVVPGHVDKSFWYWKYIYYPSKEVVAVIQRFHSIMSALT